MAGPMYVERKATNLISRQRIYKGVRTTASGKFSAEIWNPVIRRKVWLGTYTSSDEALKVYLSVRQDFGEKLIGKQIRRREISVNQKRIKGSNSALDACSIVNQKYDVQDKAEPFGYLNGEQVLDANGIFVEQFSKIDDLHIQTSNDGAILPN